MKGLLSDRNDLQGGGHASTGEHVVRDCWGLEHRCIQGGRVNHWDRASIGGLTDYRGVLWKWDPLRVETECVNAAFQHP